MGNGILEDMLNMIYNRIDQGGIDLEIFETEDGRNPLTAYIAALPVKLRAKTIRTIDLLKRYGKQLPAPFCKYIEDGIYELRSRQGTDITRIFYFFYDEKTAVLLNGFTKKTQKTPPNEITRARSYRDLYLRRRKENE